MVNWPISRCMCNGFFQFKSWLRYLTTGTSVTKYIKCLFKPYLISDIDFFPLGFPSKYKFPSKYNANTMQYNAKYQIFRWHVCTLFLCVCFVVCLVRERKKERKRKNSKGEREKERACTPMTPTSKCALKTELCVLESIYKMGCLCVRYMYWRYSKHMALCNYTLPCRPKYVSFVFEYVTTEETNNRHIEYA